MQTNPRAFKSVSSQGQKGSIGFILQHLRQHSTHILPQTKCI